MVGNASAKIPKQSPWGVLQKRCPYKIRKSLFFNKVVGLRPATFLKNRPWHRCFPVNFAKFSRTNFFNEHLRWLLLEIYGAHCALQSFLTRRRLIQETVIHVKKSYWMFKKNNKKNKNNSRISHIFWNSQVLGQLPLGKFPLTLTQTPI